MGVRTIDKSQRSDEEGGVHSPVTKSFFGLVVAAFAAGMGKGVARERKRVAGLDGEDVDAEVRKRVRRSS